MFFFRKKNGEEANRVENSKKAEKPIMFEMFGGWGNRIQWEDFSKRTIVGWKQKTPRIGDLIRCPMQSGNDGLFRVTSVEESGDPADMFFAETEPAGYLDDYKGEYIPESEVKVAFLR